LAAKRYKPFEEYWPAMSGGTFHTNSPIRFRITMTGVSPDLLTQRDWVGIKVFLNR
jgi:hypothetical protein